MIRVTGLSKSYGPHLAVNDLTFHADRGEILGFLGPNGAGKTTTMRILAGFMPPSAGVAQVAGFDVVDQSLEVRRRVGYLPETVPLYPEMSVGEYLAFMGSLRRVPELEARIDAVLEEVRLLERKQSLIGNLSKGLRQRLGLAQALLHQPEVLILDEPTIGLDPAQIIEVRRIIQGLGDQRTVLLSTHILSEAQQVCDRVLIINRGTIVAEDTPENLQAQLAGTERFQVTASLDGAELRRLLQGIPGVSAVRLLGAEGEAEISGTPGQDLRPEVARRIIEAGADLYALTPVGLSLEEVFLQLTREEAEAQEAA